jgi:hypothetical protein
MKNYHNIRNKMGRFTKQIRRAKNGKFVKRARIVAGRLYGFKNLIVRAGHVENGLRFISVHNTLFGFTPETNLYKIDKSKVNSYLSNTR